MGDLRLTWELRGVNGRGLDLRLRLPDGFGRHEAALRKALSEAVARGSVNLVLKVSRDDAAAMADLDPAALDAALSSIAAVRGLAEARGLVLADPTPVDILTMRGMADGARQDLPEIAEVLADAEPLIASFVAMRRAEGQALRAVLTEQVDRIAALTEAAVEATSARQEAQAETFRANVARILQAAEADEARIAQELALLAVKSDVTEEIDRLRAHVAAARDLLAAGGPVGRKLDFLMQEFNREANTLCSKSGDAALTAIGLDLKLAIDQMREQVQNVE